ncbi:Fun14p CYBJADRAFT_168299 [Cyberlindnera jadinii NRRL Y-1542]|uniref:FUN14-domain-containing protein n=1 Tax=Cyberlindnera jadinii (strain ATCC 18201 / CBS 1600 / BCRC 20928 / JCM 3617 / NBRC 0987 / NRRL Y-1542) TaxID=983966 RepID=A0A1E4RZT9_CYBJN|nr:hypothetical protein CYBJADRAFT_168299 [Cyberlindnera jadinii NRRL Y-1542]ODV72762.1 hypothetical protein CYBJADRAFT_168299 [Cyberlindnera jadinii NRRL Y-1542]
MFFQSTFKTVLRNVKQYNVNRVLRQTLFHPSWSASSKSLVHARSGSSISKLALIVGASGAFALQAHSKILNEAVNLGTIDTSKLQSNIKAVDPTAPQPAVVNSRLNGNLKYRQLCYGSLIGLFTGVVVGKLSSVLGFITLSTVLLLQFLQSRGIIHIPWTTIVRVGSDRVDLRNLFFEDPSFKISFALSFIIAAFNI